MTAAHLLKTYQSRFHQYALQHFPTPSHIDERVVAAAKYSFFNEGKRLRPALIYACADSFSIDLDAVDAAAFAIECIHTYSLIHDDLPSMDDDAIRRGKPACHIAFDEATAILAGDGLNTLAFEHLSQSSQTHASFALQQIHMLASSAGFAGMVGGQDMDIQLAQQGITDTSIEQLMLLHQQKTGRLIQACLLLAYQAHKTPLATVTQQLTDLGKALGLFYQIQDDILDATQSTDILGKPTRSDDKNNKPTYVSLLGLEQAKIAMTEQREQIIQLLHAVFGSNYQTQPLSLIIQQILARHR